MPASRRLISTLTIPLVGAAAFALGLATGPARSTASDVHAQDECMQPAAGGCPLELNAPVQGAIDSGSTTHEWRLAIAGVPDFSVSLIGLPGNYALSVYRPDGAIFNTSDNPGAQDEVIRVNGAADGTYRIVVSSPSGDASALPYTLFANAIGPEEAPVPFSTYAPPPRGFTAY